MDCEADSEMVPNIYAHWYTHPRSEIFNLFTPTKQHLSCILVRSLAVITEAAGQGFSAFHTCRPVLICGSVGEDHSPRQPKGNGTCDVMG